jgi:hypothetical protein
MRNGEQRIHRSARDSRWCAAGHTGEEPLHGRCRARYGQRRRQPTGLVSACSGTAEIDSVVAEYREAAGGEQEYEGRRHRLDFDGTLSTAVRTRACTSSTLSTPPVQPPAFGDSSTRTTPAAIWSASCAASCSTPAPLAFSSSRRS